MCNRTDESTSVTIVAMNVINERTNGNIELVDAPSCACSNVPGIDIILEVANTIISIKILQIKPAIIAQRELSAMSCNVIF
jgi:hypothetical protein